MPVGPAGLRAKLALSDAGVTMPLFAGTVPLCGAKLNGEAEPLPSVPVHANAELPPLMIVKVLAVAVVPQSTRPLVPKKTSVLENPTEPLVPWPVIGIVATL